MGKGEADMSRTMKTTRRRLGAIQASCLGTAAAAVLIVGSAPIALGAPHSVSTVAMHSTGSLPHNHLLTFTATRVIVRSEPGGMGNATPGDLHTDAMHSTGSLPHNHLLTFTPTRVIV